MLVRNFIIVLALWVGPVGIPASARAAPRPAAEHGAGASSQNAPTSDQETARQLLGEGRIQAAIEILEPDVGQSESAEARRLLGRAYYLSSRWADALDQLQRAIALDPQDVPTRLDVADVYLSASLPDEAEGFLNDVLENTPNVDFEPSRLQAAYFALSGSYADAGRIGAAARAMERAASLAGPIDRATILRRLGDFRTTLVEFERAHAAYAEAIALDPAAAGTRVALGDLHRRMNEPLEALEQYDRALEIGRGYLPAHTGRAEAYMMLDRIDNAVDAAEQAVALDGTNRRARYVFGRALALADRTEEASEHLAEYQRLEQLHQIEDHRDRETHAVQSAAMVHLFAGDADRAVSMLDDASRRLPDVSDLRFSLGLVLSQAGRHEEAVDVFLDLLGWPLEDPAIVHRHLAREYSLIGNAEASRRHAVSAGESVSGSDVP